MFYALAFNCNTYLLGVGGMLFFSYACVYFRRREWRTNLRAVGLAGGGFLLALGLLYLARYSAAPGQGFAFDLVNLRVSKQLMTGLGKQWHVPVTGLLQAGWTHLAAPLVILTALAALLMRRRESRNAFTFHAFLNLALVSAVFLAVDFGLHVAVISLFYYFIYLFPACVFAIAALAGEVSKGVDATAGRWIALGGVALGAACFAGTWRAPIFGWSNWCYLALVGLALWGGTWFAKRAPRAALGGVFAGVAASMLCFLAAPHDHYGAFKWGDPQTEWNVYRAALRLQKLVDQYPSRQGATGFWYRNRSRTQLDSVQSMYLWGYTRIASGAGSGTGMPEMTADELTRAKQFRYLCVMGESRNEVERGVDALRRLGMQVRVLQSAQYKHAEYETHFVMVERGS